MMKAIPATLLVAGLLAVPVSSAVFAEESAGRSQDSASGTSRSPDSSSVGRYIDDAAITARIKGRFVEDSSVSALGISVETKNGIVQISGFANSEAEKARAASIASSVPDVRQVQNNIVVKKSDSTGSSRGSSSSPSDSSTMREGSGTGSSGSRY